MNFSKIVTSLDISETRIVVSGDRPLLFRRVEPDDAVSLLVEDEGGVVDVQLVVAENALFSRRF